jgi:hypothetical protein
MIGGDGMEEIALIEKRTTPRVDANFSVCIEGKKGESVNLSDNGICFRLPEKMNLSKTVGSIEVPDGILEINLEIIWQNEIDTSDDYIYGARYVDIEDDDLNRIRKNLILKKIKETIKLAKDKESRRQISVFCKHVSEYFFQLFELADNIGEEKITTKESNLHLHELTEKVMRKADEFEKNVKNKMIAKKIKEEFRNLVGCWAYKSYIVKRSFDKPRGYPGDYNIMETIYDEQILSEGIGRCYDVYFQNNEYAVAVKARKDWMREYLRIFMESRLQDEIKILNIACGSNREMRELFSDSDFLENIKDAKKRITIGLLDQDEDAIAFSKKELEPYTNKIHFSYFEDNIMAFIKDKDRLVQQIGRYDLIYSIGLADYLPDRILGSLLSAWTNDYLRGNGVLIIAHKDISKYKPLPPNWFCDWNFYSRDQQDVTRLIEQYCDKKPKISRDDSGLILFFEIQKKT